MRLRHLLAVFLTVAIPASASAQDDDGPPVLWGPWAVSVSYGLFKYTIPVKGESRMVAARLERPMSKYVIAEGGVLYAHREQVRGDTAIFFGVEIGVQAQLPLGPIAPYGGISAGKSFDFQSSYAGTNSDQSAISAALAAGLRAWFSSNLGARAEVRLRGLSQQNRRNGSATEWTAGLTWRL